MQKVNFAYVLRYIYLYSSREDRISMLFAHLKIISDIVRCNLAHDFSL